MIRTVVCCLLLFLSGFVNSSNTFEFQGRAYDAKTDQFLYLEKHKVILDEEGNYESSRVQYIDEKGELFASKQVSYEASLTAPSFTFFDYRTDSQVTVQNRVKSIKLTSKTGSTETTQDVDIARPSGLVVDAGFDRFIYENWEYLLQNKDVSFAFLAISRAMVVSLDVKEKNRMNDSVVLVVEPSNFFLKLLVDPIELTYNIDSQRLTRFEGLTNIAKSTNGKVQDDHYVAVIQYEYF